MIVLYVVGILFCLLAISGIFFLTRRNNPRPQKITDWKSRSTIEYPRKALQLESSLEKSLNKPGSPDFKLSVSVDN